MVDLQSINFIAVVLGSVPSQKMERRPEALAFGLQLISDGELVPRVEIFGEEKPLARCIVLVYSCGSDLCPMREGFRK